MRGKAFIASGGTDWAGSTGTENLGVTATRSEAMPESRKSIPMAAMMRGKTRLSKRFAVQVAQTVRQPPPGRMVGANASWASLDTGVHGDVFVFCTYVGGKCLVVKGTHETVGSDLPLVQAVHAFRGK